MRRDSPFSCIFAGGDTSIVRTLYQQAAHGKERRKMGRKSDPPHTQSSSRVVTDGRKRKGKG